MKKNKLLLIVAVLGVLLIHSCKRYVDPPPYFEQPEVVKSSSIERKVLLIAIDGAPSDEINTLKLPVLEELKKHSKYSWDCFSDLATLDASSWKTLMSGKTFLYHQIFDSSFLYTRPPGVDNHTTTKNYPSLFYYILNSKRPDLKTAFISPWKQLVNNLVPEVQDPVVAANDLAVKDSAISKLKNTSPQLMVVNFNSTAIAGKAGSFSAADAGFASAAKKLDGYIGEIMTTLKARPQYNKNEEWLVVITSTHGGIGNSYGGSSKKETDVFTFYYNENFKPIEISHQGAVYGVNIKGGGANAIKAVTRTINNIPDPGEYQKGNVTYQLSIKGTINGQNPVFLYKREEENSGAGLIGGTTGFTFFTNNSKSWNVDLKGTSNTIRFIENNNLLLDGKWHNITMVFVDSNNTRYIKRYMDGAKFDERDIKFLGKISSTEPITLGYGKGNAGGVPEATFVDFTAVEFKIFNVALSSNEIRATNCLTDVTKHPKYSNLVCYWPLTDEAGGLFKNKVSNGEPLVLKGAFLWEEITEFPCMFNRPPPKDSTVSMFSKTVDIIPNAFYWLDIPISSAWGFEGTRWLDRFDREFIKLK